MYTYVIGVKLRLLRPSCAEIKALCLRGFPGMKKKIVNVCGVAISAQKGIFHLVECNVILSTHEKLQCNVFKVVMVTPILLITFVV